MPTFIGSYADADDTLNTRMAEMSDGIESPYPTLIKGTVSEVGNMVRAISGMIDAADPDLSNDGNFKKVMKRIDEANSYTTKALNRQADLREKWEADLTQRENAACGFDRGSSDEQRILNKFCGKDIAAQTQDMAQRLKDPNAGYWFGIIAKADPYVTNLTPELVARFRADFVKLHQPKLARERASIAKIVEAAQARAGLTMRVKSSVGDTARYNAILNRTAKHSAADAEFLAALTRGAA